MSGFDKRLPASGAAIYRFTTPSTPKAVPPGEPAGYVPGEAPLPVQLPRTHGSAVLAGLPSSLSGFQAKLAAQQRNRPRDGTAAVGRNGRHGARAQGTPEWHEAQEAGEDWKHFWTSMRPSSRRGSSGDGSAQGPFVKAGAMPTGSFLHGTDRPLPMPPSRMAEHALSLPASCEAEMARSGVNAMPAFLRAAMTSLVIDFVKDVAARIDHRSATGSPRDPADATLPVRETTDEFLNLMRPLYQRYVDTPSLYDDACDVLCGAQPLLQEEMRQRGKGQGDFSRVMTESVCALFPVLVMGCIPRPKAGNRARIGQEQTT